MNMCEGDACARERESVCVYIREYHSLLCCSALKYSTFHNTLTLSFIFRISIWLRIIDATSLLFLRLYSHSPSPVSVFSTWYLSLLCLLAYFFCPIACDASFILFSFSPKIRSYALRACVCVCADVLYSRSLFLYLSSFARTFCHCHCILSFSLLQYY